MKSRHLYIGLGIFSVLLFTAALVLVFLDSESGSIGPVPLTFLLVAFFFMSVLYFKISARKRSQSPASAAEKYLTEGEIIKSEEEQAKEEAQTREENKKMARELADKLFDLPPAETPEALAQNLLKTFANELNVVQSLLFMRKPESNQFTVAAKYAFYSVEPPKDFEEGDGITGQAAKDKRILNINTIPEGYITVISGLGSSTPRHMLVLPFIHKDKTQAIMETAAFEAFPVYIEEACKLYYEKIGERFAAFRDIAASDKND